MTSNLLAYGTLRNDKIMSRVIGENCLPLFQKETTLIDYQLYYVSGELYPVLVKEIGQKITVSLFQNLSSIHWKRLINYEGQEYQVEEIVIDDHYYKIFIPSNKVKISNKIWTFDSFIKNDLVDYTSNWKNF